MLPLGMFRRDKKKRENNIIFNNIIWTERQKDVGSWLLCKKKGAMYYLDFIVYGEDYTEIRL